MTQALQEAWASMEEMELTQRKQHLALYKKLKETPHWFYYEGHVYPLELIKMTPAGNVQLRGGKEWRKRHILTIRNNTWLDIYDDKKEALEYALKHMQRRHENAKQDVREYAKETARCIKDLATCNS